MLASTMALGTSLVAAGPEYPLRDAVEFTPRAGLPDGVHTVTVTVDAQVPDKMKILFEHNRPDMEKNPAKYAGTTWYAGSIMLIGDLVE